MCLVSMPNPFIWTRTCLLHRLPLQSKAYTTTHSSWRVLIHHIFYFGVRRPNVFAPKNGHVQWFGVQKMGLWTPISKSDTTFCRQLYPNMVDETLDSYEYHYWVGFGQILKMAYFMLIFGQFPLLKSQNQNPMLPSVNFWDKTLIFGIWFPYI